MESKSDDASGNTITFTVFTSMTTELNKKFSRVENKIVKSSMATMSKGTYATQTVNGPEELNEFLNNLKSNQAVSIGICNKGPSGKIKSKKSQQKGAITRTKDNFEYSNCFIFDIDDSTLTIDEVIPTLCQIDPNLINADILVRASSSYGVYKEGDKPNVEMCGYHVWILGVKDPSDIARYGQAFAKLCWLKGNGHIIISNSGSMLVRQLIDASVFSPERLVFEASPTLAPGIKQLERPCRIQRGASHV